MILRLALVAPCLAQFGSFFDQIFGDHHQQFQQQQQQQQGPEIVNNVVENTYIDMACDRFLCEDTLVCVETPGDCPCQFPDSQMKCVLPDGQGYVCISKPSNDEGPTCDFVVKAASNLI